MKISMYAMSVELCLPMLSSLLNILDKAAASAEARKFDSKVLADARLAPDMHPLTRQVQLACDFAKGGAARLAGQDPPKHEDTEQTFAELRARLEKTIAFLRTIPASAVDGSEDRDIRIPMRERTLEMKGLAYLQKFVLPNFYFHVVTAYTILRHNGVGIGKMDYLGRA
jgi:hypothetical protein